MRGPSFNDIAWTLFLGGTPFSKHVKRFFSRDADTHCTDGECSSATDAASGRGGSRRAHPVRTLRAPRHIHFSDSFPLSLRLVTNTVRGPQPTANPNLLPGMYRPAATI